MFKSVVNYFKEPPLITKFIGETTSDLKSIFYLTDGRTDRLYEDGFRNADFVLLNIEEGGINLEMPAVILKSYKRTGIPRTDKNQKPIRVIHLLRQMIIPPHTPL